MADESLRFDIIGRDNASGAFSRVAASVKEMGDRMDVATRHALVMDEAIKKQQTAARASADATLSLAKADTILTEAERRLTDGALEAEFALKKQADAAKKAGRDNQDAAGGFSALAGNGGIPGGGMGAAIAAGALLSPILVTVGSGIAGLGLAAYGIAKPIEKAAQATGGLQANLGKLDPEQQAAAKSVLALGQRYAKFQQDLKPVLLSDFSKAVSVAGHLMGDFEPVTKATGVALGGLFSQLDNEFKSNTWQNFFQFMAKTAGPDVKLLGNAFVSLTSALPPLLEALQPVAASILKVITYTGDAIRLSELASTNFQDLGKASQKSAGGFNALTTGAQQAIPGLGYMAKLGRELGQGLDILYGNSGKASKGIKGLSGSQESAAAAAKAQTAAINALNTALTTNVSKVLTLEGDEVAWKQAQQAATQAVNQNHNALDGNSKSALAARAAIIQATGAVVQFASEQLKAKGNLQGASNAIQDQIGWLEKHAGKSKIAAQEIKALRDEEAKIKAQINSQITISGSGSWQLASSQHLHGLAGQGAAGGFASGRYITQGTTATADDVLARVSKGELVVPTHLVNAGAVDHLRGMIPGFASGGVVPSFSGSVPGETKWLAGNLQGTFNSFANSLAHSFAGALASASTGAGGPASAGAAAAQQYAASLLGAYGWGGSQMAPLIALWNRESGWNRLAMNPSSGAFGIAQALGHGLPGTAGTYGNQYPSVAANDGSAAAQIAWGLGYIRGQYGSPAGAWAHEITAGWYDQGGYLPPGLSLAYNGTGRPERVGGGNSYHITVNVPAGANLAEAGRVTVAAIREFEKRAGAGWRK